ncbi:MULTISPECIES: relaxase/mobilization nuclease domain-containing protein [unclassified Chryseobacterium]|uniref:relaxase/mobilization nuclease domain-containing protein n=1 Tax=unclassified Chryseobacterium TaxID=2593645 RepID=UPI000D364818|nr:MULTISPECIES: relaxase/mobilization nuclease domain-containing protein [unclassified Chryseobacterium]PTT76536.1 hypothetical protein DBR25_05485 [Chryseobacterium sp. HMWF001]PVV55579.1 hypothetical protein DD829_14000 [Chryseobacterium sp. HMWF035]
MIIKSTSYKSISCFSSIPKYILRDSERDNSFVLTQFIKGDTSDINRLAMQLASNEEFRKRKCRNNVLLYMDILSFHAHDTPSLSNDKLQVMAMKYLSLRAPRSLAVATVHRNDKQHVHLHICFSAMEYKTGKVARISKKEFSRIKEQMEAFQKERFPELEYSSVRHGRTERKSKRYRKEKETAMTKRGRISEKQQLCDLLDDVFQKAGSEKEFYTILQERGVEIYTRNNEPAGVRGKRKFRFKTLGYDKQILQSLEQNSEVSIRMKMLHKLRENRHEKEHELAGKLR